MSNDATGQKLIATFQRQLAFESLIYGSFLIYFLTLDWASSEVKIHYFGAGCMIALSAYLRFSSGVHSVRFLTITTKEHSPKMFYAISAAEILVAVVFICLSFLSTEEYRGGKHSTIYQAYIEHTSTQDTP